MSQDFTAAKGLASSAVTDTREGAAGWGNRLSLGFQKLGWNDNPPRPAPPRPAHGPCLPSEGDPGEVLSPVGWLRTASGPVTWRAAVEEGA